VHSYISFYQRGAEWTMALDFEADFLSSEGDA